MKPPLLGGGGSRVPHPGGEFFPRLKVGDAGEKATPRGLSPKAHRYSPVCPKGLTGRGGCRVTLTSDNGVLTG